MTTSELHAPPGATPAPSRPPRVRWWRLPFSADSWQRTFYILLALPVGLVAVPLVLAGGGLEATRLIVGGDEPAPRVLVLTTFDPDEYVFEALRAGASSFLLKDASARQLAEAVRVVAAGDALLSPSVTKRLISAFARMGGPKGPRRRVAGRTPSFSRPTGTART